MDPIPSLLGDGEGNYKVRIVGNSGAYIAAKLNVPHIPLDALFWEPGWGQPSSDEFRERVSVAMAHYPKGWVIDGNYSSLGTLISDHATDIIWLDPPLWYYLPRLLWRTLLRLLKIAPTCAEGCTETWGDVLSKEGIVWFCISNHGHCKRRYDEIFARTSIEKGGNMRRLNEWNGDLAAWKAGLEWMLR
ncbi:hypothetical protein AZE42_06176 [Rhizopogon vesiculosus]|uniref:Uncharacterized protein n=1 Tax=Rhizopogon vesiculosus TaxID=180088 RepID=A0A1J8QB52_9AGAM|nr:hypothetical protein AZE42_06176 [Rhizopogon vesiculosus]